MLKIQVPHKSPKLPDFLILGAAKAGTTALFKAVGRHPQVFSPAVASIILANGPTLDPAVRRSLAKTYHDDLDLVEEMTGRNLDAWRT